MWREAVLKIPDELRPLECSIVPAHPWVYGLGHGTDNGAYLSPVNAVEYLAGKLAGSGGEGDVIVLMVCNATYDEFIAGLKDLAAVFPTPAFTQIARFAAAASQLDAVKMQLPGKRAGGLPAAVALSVPTSRIALSAQRIAAAQAEAATGSNPIELAAQLLAFTQARASMLAAISKELEDLKTGAARVYAFSFKGLYGTAAAEMVKDIPQSTAVLTAAMMFTGEDLSALEGMLHA